MVFSSTQTGNKPRGPFLLSLNWNGGKPPLTRSGHLRGSWTAPYAARSAVIAGPAHGNAAGRNTSGIKGPDVRNIDVVNGTVVIECAATPIAAPVAKTGITKAIINAAVKAGHRAPISSMPEIHSV